MKILALDTASAGCNVCVWQDGDVIALQTEKMARGQDGRLIPLIEEAMEEAGLAYADLDRIAVTRGPGSFTGIRVGLATARGIGLASEKPVVGIDRFSVFHRLYADHNPLLVAIDSRRLELFVHLFNGEGDFNPETAQMLPPEDIAEIIKQTESLSVAGDGAEALEEYLSPSMYVEASEDAEVVACAALAAEAEVGAARFLPRPLYLRAPDVNISKKKL